MKDNEIRDFVSALTKVAEEYGQTQQLRERIRGIVFPFIEEARRTVSGQEAKPVAVMWFEPGSGKPQFAGLYDTVQAGTWENGTKLYAAPIPATELPSDLLALLVDDVQDYADSREFKEVEAKWRANLLKRGRAILAAAKEG